MVTANDVSQVTDTIFFYAKTEDAKWNPLFTIHKRLYVTSNIATAIPMEGSIAATILTAQPKAEL